MSKALAKKALPSKEAGLFKELLSLYETRQLKKGVKTADQILKKFPDHGGMKELDLYVFSPLTVSLGQKHYV
jgi:hypothetical protein